MSPAFSVIIPTYGRQAFLLEAVRSVLGQSFEDFECIVVDDASPEAPSLPFSDARLRLVRRPTNGGPSAARNSGLLEATGRYVAFLDDDDVWTPNRLEGAVEAHRRAPVAICWQSTLGAASAVAGRVLEGDVGDTILDGIIPHLGATSIERDRAPAFDERFEASDDVEWWLRVARQLPVATAPTVGLLYRVHSGPRSRTGQANRVKEAQMLMAEHRDWFARHPRAKAFRLKRMGLSALRVGDRRLALRCFAGSFRLDPQPRTALHAVRAVLPRRQAHDE